MAALSPQGALLTLCISRLPQRSLPRHAWAAEVLVEQLWGYVDQDRREGRLRETLSCLVCEKGVKPQRVRAEMLDLAQSGALVPVGVGADARFEVAGDLDCDELAGVLCAPRQDQRAVDFAVDQLTARLLAFSKTA